MMDRSITLILLTLGGIGATYVWRAVGVIFATKITTDSPVFLWVTVVSYAMLGGLIARMIVMPIGPLVEVSLTVRLLSFATGLACFFLTGKRIFPGVIIGVGLFIALQYFYPQI
ncbi:MAG: AzlD domain-containing protein [Gammaproteobacteria bacterium]|jgi:branched-subunit amino acid transport protein|nr:AzlD domain-containing protein [Gammaproteobacteria bacterium]NDA15271.1 AzlD domain-containing protein [Gammaproteobacteria bacterium]NDG44704.1 AzlD domain-containing protein [Gammaproteobacteria bacterium]